MHTGVYELICIPGRDRMPDLLGTQNPGLFCGTMIMTETVDLDLPGELIQNDLLYEDLSADLHSE